MKFIPEETLKKAIDKWGKNLQLDVAIEEMAELIKEICKHKRGKENKSQITEELADVFIMLFQVQMIFDINDDDLLEILNKKLERLSYRIVEQQ